VTVIRRAAAALAACALLVLPAPLARADDPPPTFTLTGAGYGHGVGMSQWGAYGMAKAGYDATGIVTHYYTGTAVTPVQDDMDIRVNLLYRVGSAKLRTEALEAGGGAVEVTVGGNVVLGGPADEFRFDAGGGQVHVVRVTAGQTTDLGSAPTATVRWAGTRTPGTAAGGATVANVVSSVSLDSSGHRFRYGYLDVEPAGGGTLNVVNSVRLHDEYLWGISEVSSSWPDAAQQAQVLAARTYALAKLASGVRSACDCHVDDGGGPYADQTFTGWTKASAAQGSRWVANVNATAASPTTGLAILYNGQPIKAFYSSSSGGWTQSVADVWGGALPYAVAVPDPWMADPANPNRAWTVVVPQARMAQVFGIGAIAKLAVSQRYVSGAVQAVTATAPDGSVTTISGTRFANGLGLKSKYVNAINGDAGVPLPSATPAPPATPAPAAPAPAPATPAVPVSNVKARTVSLLTPVTVTRKAGGTYKVVGVVRPAKKGLKAWRQRLVGETWTTVGKDATNPKGRYRFVKLTVTPKSSGTYRVLVVRKGVVVGVSPTFTVGVK
jgi:stage II sporulation protein D